MISKRSYHFYLQFELVQITQGPSCSNMSPYRIHSDLGTAPYDGFWLTRDILLFAMII